jgi:hypothetical protein
MEITKESWIAALLAVADGLKRLTGGLSDADDKNWKAKLELGVAIGVLNVRVIALQTRDEAFGEADVRATTEHLMGLVGRVRVLTNDENFISAVLDALEPINALLKSSE